MTLPTSRTFLRLAVWLAPVLILAWVTSQHLLFSGQVTLRCSAERCDPRIKNFAARERELLVGTSKETGNQYRLITADPITFDTKLLRSMQRATVRLTYQNPDSVERLRIGVLSLGSKHEYFDLADALPHEVTLENTWKKTQEDEVTLFTRPAANVRQFVSIDEFLNNRPESKRLAAFNVDVTAIGRIPGYRPSSTALNLHTALRGSHTLAVYLGKGETLDLTFQVQDLNRLVGKDDLVINVQHGDDTLLTQAFRDDGNDKANGVVSEPRTFHVTLPAPTEGTYRVELASKKGDFLIRSIESRQQLLMFGSALSPAASTEYAEAGITTEQPLTVFVQGTRLTAQTSHQKSLQTLSVGARKLELKKINEPQTVRLSSSTALVPVTIPRPDVYLETDGVFVLSPPQFYNQQQFATDRLTEARTLDQYDYVLARYVKPQHSGKWLVATKEFSAIPAGRVVHFVISTDPSLNDSRKTLRIRELEVRLTGDPLTPVKFLGLVKKFFQNFNRGPSNS